MPMKSSVSRLSRKRVIATQFGGGPRLGQLGLLVFPRFLAHCLMPFFRSLLVASRQNWGLRGLVSE